jgi:hypothetical protein
MIETRLKINFVLKPLEHPPTPSYTHVFFYFNNEILHATFRYFKKNISLLVWIQLESGKLIMNIFVLA